MPNAPALQILNHSQKIFEVGPEGQGRMALATWGAGSVNHVSHVSHRTVAARLADRVKEETSISDATKILQGIVAEHKPDGEFGYFLGGTNIPSREPECYILNFKPEQVIDPIKLGIGQGTFQGAPELFIRAFHGCDPKFLTHLVAQLKNAVGERVENFEQIFSQALDAAIKTIPHGGYSDLPIREAIDFVHMYLHLTIKGFKFRFGAPVCGGPIEIAFVTTDRPFRWARHKRFDTAIFEEEVGEL
jgi:hypothetical protein